MYNAIVTRSMPRFGDFGVCHGDWTSRVRTKGIDRAKFVRWGLLWCFVCVPLRNNADSWVHLSPLSGILRSCALGFNFQMRLLAEIIMPPVLLERHVVVCFRAFCRQSCSSAARGDSR